MTQYTPPKDGCEKCGVIFSWMFVDETEMGDIYECENCNNMVVVRVPSGMIENDN